MGNNFVQGYGLIIGVGADLPNTIDDAKGIADILQDSERCAYLPEHVKLLTGEESTRESVISTLDKLAQETDIESTVIVYFSGHGYRVSSPSGEYYYLMPYGYNTAKLSTTAISGAEFTQKLKAIPAKKLVVLLDCCHAGGVGEGKAPGVEFSKSPLPPEALSLLEEGGGQILIASSKEDELSYPGKPYSAFTLALIEALCGSGVSKKDGYVRVADLALHAREVVPGRTSDKQHPVLHFVHADNFVLAYYAGGDSEPKGLPFGVEPVIEPEPGAWTKIDQRGQTVHGPQTNIAGYVVQAQDDIFHDEGIRVGDIIGSTGVAIGHGARSTVTQHRGLSVDEISTAFTAIKRALDSLPDDENKEEVQEAVGKLEAEARKGDQAEESRVRRWFNFLAEDAPDAFDVAIDIFIHPIKGISTVFQKLAARAKENRQG